MMTLNQFGKYIFAMTEDEYNPQKIQLTANPFRKIYWMLVREFYDRDRNLKRWLLGKTCIYYHTGTKQWITVEIGKDVEAIYYFLLFCKKMNNYEHISDEFSDYLALVISRSVYQYDEEC